MQKVGKVNLPEGKTIAVNLGFDFDSSSIWMNSFEEKSPVFISRGEFGAEVGVPRILKLLDKYNLKGTFFVPGHTADTYPEICKMILEQGSEIGHHGYIHEDPTFLSREEEETIIIKGLEALERVGVKPLGYRSPGWDFSPNTVELLEKHGFKYDSSLMGQDFYPYRPRPCELHFDKGNVYGEPGNIVEMPVSWYMDDFPHFEFIPSRGGMKAPSDVFEIWKDTFDYGVENTEGGMLTVTMHPQVTGRAHHIMMLEKFIKHMLSKNAWIAPMKDIYDRIEF